ncbi:DUF397 domain-containing protein [Streptomyces sp. TRM 70351]|uniref:DUF397 domain-containing protein n=1 Tax=Streptomyces sp. TRM 70351 TaxID=3116552 RepID=UPI002E7BC32E|nr:DUF397 domain-containing protein [Streptomyces sp. TRM 70351]MEE1929687.1 DUF397 domain-containing protein [Streptomyces sp. TRM 70351]
MSSTPDSGTTISWVKSTYSGGEGGQCVEWAPAYAADHGIVPVRDSKQPYGPVLHITPHGWTGFVTALQHGDLGTA